MSIQKSIQNERSFQTAGLTVIDRVVTPTSAERLKLLSNEAEALAKQMVEEALEALRLASIRLDELAKAGPLVQVGIRERGRQLSDSLLAEIEQIAALRNRRSEA